MALIILFNCFGGLRGIFLDRTTHLSNPEGECSLDLAVCPMFK